MELDGNIFSDQYLNKKFHNGSFQFFRMCTLDMCRQRVKTYFKFVFVIDME